jgi:hypothetical protein
MALLHQLVQFRDQLVGSPVCCIYLTLDLGDAVIINVGNNGPFTAEQFDEMMGVLAGVPKVLIVSLTVPPRVKDPVALPTTLC